MGLVIAAVVIFVVGALAVSLGLAPWVAGVLMMGLMGGFFWFASSGSLSR
jgi:hypothetical protein